MSNSNVAVLAPQENVAEKISTALAEKFIRSEKVARILALAVESGKNVLLWGPGGHGKSEMVETALAQVAAQGEIFTQSFGEGMDEAKLWGGLNFKKLEEEKVMEYFPENSFLVKKIAVFEEMFDAPPSTLMSLKDTLTSKILRQGAQQFPMATKSIVAITNKDPDEISDMGPAAHALIERFPLQLCVDWDSYESSDYNELFEKVGPNLPGAELNGTQRVLAEIIAKAGDEGDIISPRTAIHALGVVKTAAAIRGSDKVEKEDLVDLQYLPGMEDLAENISAELNALNKYLRQSPATTTHHALLPTDTWLGKQTAQMVSAWLKNNNKGSSFEVMSITGLQTQKIDQFQLALSDLSKQLIETIADYRVSQTHIAFNLTGGFKAVIGFLQTISTCLADESFYIFERSEDLLRIPKLPVQLTTEEVFNEHTQVFQRIALDLPVTQEECQNIPETLLFTIDGNTMLSALGQLQWDAAKKEIYHSQLLPPPSAKIRITPECLASLQALDPARRYEINKRMDELACYLEAPNKSTAPNPKSLSFKDFKSKKGTYQLYAWSDRDARRIYGHFLDNGNFQIDSFEKHA